MTQAIHIVLQGKGGVGKSVISRLLLEYMVATDRDYIGFDADPVNQTFAAHNNKKVSVVELIKGSRVDNILFDEMLEKIFTNKDKKVILDTGASSFLPFMEYIATNDVIAVLQSEGFEVFIHTIVIGETAAADTIKGFEQLAARFGESANLIVWENRFFGPITLGGKAFEDIAGVKKVIEGGLVSGKIVLEKSLELHERAFLDFLKQGKSFDEASSNDNADFNTMMRNRIKQLKETYISALEAVIGDVNDTGVEADAT